MGRLKKRLKIGILGCGAIGSRIAVSVQKELKDLCRLSGLYDINPQKAQTLEKKVSGQKLIKKSLNDLIHSCDLMVEAVNAPRTDHLIRKALVTKKHVLAMSVGKLLNSDDLFKLAQRNRCCLLIPSGAIAGIDAIKSAGLTQIQNIILTTKKPPSNFADIAYIKEQGIDLSQITKETLIFEGDVDTAVKLFPQNINVAATLALASQAKSKILIRIITAPHLTQNSHEIEMTGDFGQITTKTENMVCPDNPKTSFLAVLSGIQTLKEFCLGTHIGT